MGEVISSFRFSNCKRVNERNDEVSIFTRLVQAIENCGFLITHRRNTGEEEWLTICFPTFEKLPIVGFVKVYARKE